MECLAMAEVDYMNNNIWHQKIKDTIEKCEYEFYTINPINSITCTCVNHATKQADPRCMYCLGTGYKIKIRKIKGASNEIESNIAGKGVKGSAAESVGRTYFIDSKYPIGEHDLIVDNDEILYVYRIYKMKGLKGEHTHNEIKVIPKRNDSSAILANFKRIMKMYKK